MESIRDSCIGYGIAAKGEDIKPLKFTRAILNPDEVQIKLLFCGVCHSDIHHTYNEWHDSMYPMVPGHEMTGVVMAVGSDVTNFTIGEKVAVGNLIDSCRRCKSCLSGEEQYCENGGPTWVYPEQVGTCSGPV